MAIVYFLGAFIFSVCLGSVIEWFVHRDLMHSIKWLRTPHQRHAVEHHAERKAPGKYYAKEDELKEYHLFETSFMPLLWVLHAPLFAFVCWWLGAAASLGVAAGTAFYVLGYETLHWYMHCPDDFIFRDHLWFRFLSEHHRLHHNKSTINYNVVLPLGDLLMGTFVTNHVIKREPEDLRRSAPLPPQAPAKAATEKTAQSH